MCYDIPSVVGFLFFVLHFVHVMHLISCHHVKPSTKLEDGGSIMGLRPGGGLRHVVLTAVRVKLVV